MSGIEERLVRDIAAVAEGVVVTESDLQDARHEVLERIDTVRQRNLRRIVATAVAVAVVGAAGVTALQTMRGDDRTAPPSNQPTTPVDPDEDFFLTGSTPSPEILAGVWRIDGGRSLIRFTVDGTVAISSDGNLYDGAVVAPYAIDGDLIAVDSLSGPAGCDVPAQLAMRASQPEAGVLHIVHTVPVAGTCISDQYERWVLEQILPPNNDGLAGLDFSGDPFGPLADPSDLLGDWMAQGGGHVLELAATSAAAANGGSYYVAAGTGGVIDSGVWSLGASRSKLRLISTSESPSCDAGERFVLGHLTHSPGSPASALRGTVEQNGCGGAWTSEIWIRLPHEGS